MLQLYALLVQGFARANLGDSAGAHASADASLAAAADLMEFFEGLGHATVAVAYQAAGDPEAAMQAYTWRANFQGSIEWPPGCSSASPLAAAGMWRCRTAREWADELVAVTYGCYLAVALMTRSQVMIAQGETCAGRS